MPANGSINLKEEASETPKYKARLVAERSTQKERIDFNEVFLLMVKHILISVLLAIKTFSDLEEILMTQLKGFIEERTKDTVYLLKKSFYRLK